MSDAALQKILIVDDTALNRQLLNELLKDEHTVILAKDGEQALEKAAQHRPDLILLDVLMPGMDGYEVLRRLKADPRTADIAVIFITGLDSPEEEAKGLSLGGSDYIAKPFHAPVVQARVALHLKLARQRRLLESLANIDALTEIANRRQVDQALAGECRRASRAATPLSIALLDIDYFKQYNDHYGHAMGDQVLQDVAFTLNKGMGRPGDLAGRYGGEEFVLIMPGTNQDGAIALADGLRSKIEALAIAHEKSSIAACITVSIGTATAHGEEMPRPDALLKIADERLYRAKALGRNRVVGA